MHRLDSGVGKDCWFVSQLFVTMSMESKRYVSGKYSLSITNIDLVGFHIKSMMAGCILWRH